MIRAHLEQQAALPFSYEAVGATRAASQGVVEGLPSDMVVDHNRVKLGTGKQTFDRAKQALHQWEMFNVDWVEFCWPAAAVEVGQTVGIMMQAGFLWSLNACRVVYLLDEPGDEVDRYGFAYGTLPDHAESGEERFLLERHRQDDSVWYDLLAFSRPSGLLTRISHRYARAIQQKFARHSLRAMCKAAA
jgi:uncharacterized protein (UPF0548 family)